jgi:hypothetical protein
MAFQPHQTRTRPPSRPLKRLFKSGEARIHAFLHPGLERGISRILGGYATGARLSSGRRFGGLKVLIVSGHRVPAARWLPTTGGFTSRTVPPTLRPVGLAPTEAPRADLKTDLHLQPAFGPSIHCRMPSPVQASKTSRVARPGLCNRLHGHSASQRR